jgi:two-component system response regulator AtoC
VVNIQISPLRERKDDITLLFNNFLKKFSHKYNKKITGVTREALAVIGNYNWPGNVRELKNICEQAVVMSRGTTILLEDLPITENNGEFMVESNGTKLQMQINYNRPLKDIVADVEKQVILGTLNKNNWNRQETAHALGLNRRSLYAKMKEYDLL